MGATDFMVISIEGNIGSGKSTLLSNLRDYYAKDANVVFLKEPVDEWEQITDKERGDHYSKILCGPEKVFVCVSNDGIYFSVECSTSRKKRSTKSYK